ncbi:MAG: hypothetical protein C4547_16880 [Phycisphaerales bacterium]|nr:MAG: hypothetical protein C4547_16880 [Phycisphaerales bacterium]
MGAINAKYDGRQVILPDGMPNIAPGEVILVFEEIGRGGDAPASEARAGDTLAWQQAQESAFARAWDNDDDAV